MDPELKKEWVEALRSENYSQGRGRLKSYNNEYCCLGVLCDIIAKKEEGYWIGDGRVFSYKGEASSGSLTFKLKEEIGIKALNDFGLSEPGTLVDLIDLNDEDRASFGEIADYIEKHL